MISTRRTPFCCGTMKNPRGAYPHRCPLVPHRGQARRCSSWLAPKGVPTAGSPALTFDHPAGQGRSPAHGHHQASRRGVWRGTCRKGVVTSRPLAPPRSQGTTPAPWNPVGDAETTTPGYLPRAKCEGRAEVVRLGRSSWIVPCRAPWPVVACRRDRERRTAALPPSGHDVLRGHPRTR